MPIWQTRLATCKRSKGSGRWGVQPGGTESLTSGVWRYLQVGSVRTELTLRVVGQPAGVRELLGAGRKPAHALELGAASCPGKSTCWRRSANRLLLTGETFEQRVSVSSRTSKTYMGNKTRKPSWDNKRMRTNRKTSFVLTRKLNIINMLVLPKLS